MGNIHLLDCTLRDGGYINDWHFGKKAIKDISKKLTLAEIEYLELGFIRECDYDPDYSLFNGNDCVRDLTQYRNGHTKYVGMIDMGKPIGLHKLGKRDQNGFDAIRVIFKKNRIKEAIDYISHLIPLGYDVFAQPVGTDQYSMEEFLELIYQFNQLSIKAFYIVDSFGLIRKKQLLQLAELANDNLRDDIMLGYHSHNNLQQAMGNATSLVEMNFKRDICIDACVFGMGRGAGNLNMELFAEYMNDNYGKNYRIEPMLEIIDEHLNAIYREHFWGYSMPFYLSATNGCHPNYAVYFSKKGSFTVKSYNEILQSISKEDKALYSSEKAEEYYQNYQKNYIDDCAVLEQLSEEFLDSVPTRKVLLLGSGNSLQMQKDEVKEFIAKENPIVISLNFIPDEYEVDYAFCCHMRRYKGMESHKEFSSVKKIITSNLKDALNFDYMINFSSFNPKEPELYENSGIMFLNLLIQLGLKKVYIAGMDGYVPGSAVNYTHSGLEYDFTEEVLLLRNQYIEKDIQKKQSQMDIQFITKSLYKGEL